MKITFDPKKNADNICNRQLSFDDVAELEWSSGVVIEDIRRNYGERRFRVFGYIENRLCSGFYSPRECSPCNQFQEG